MKLIFQGNLADGGHSIDLPAGKYAGLFLMFEGTADAAATAAATDFGSMRLHIEGREVQHIDFDRLQEINLLKGGVIDVTSGAGAAFSFSAFLPFAVPGDKGNVLDVVEGQRATLTTEYAANLMAVILAGVGVGTIKVYGVLADGIQAYLLKIGQYDMNLAAGTPTDKLPRQYENIYELFLCNEANLTSVIIQADGVTKFNTTRTAMISKTLFSNKIETWAADTPWLDFLFAETGQLQESLADSVVFAFNTAGAISPENCVVFGLDFTPTDALRSQASLGANLQTTVNRKLSEGKSRPVSALEILQGS